MRVAIHSTQRRPRRDDGGDGGRAIRIRASRPQKGSTNMSIGKIAHMAEATGTAKKVFGRATGNTCLRGEGRVDQAKGNTKQAGER
jgi:uncharacterized protein YjbJ (UPF0337 family)